MQEYRQLLEDAAAGEAALERRYNFISTARLLVFLAFLLGVGFCIFDRNWIAGLLGAAFFAAFLFLIRQHDKIVNRLEQMRSRKTVLEHCLARSSEDWREFADDGGEFLKEDFPQAADLDLLGPSSLYQYLCSAHTEDGRSLLAKWLCCAEPRREESLRRQGAVKELCSKQRFSLEFQTCGGLLQNKRKDGADSGMKKLLDYGEAEPSPFPSWRKWTARVLTAVSAAVLGLVLFGVIPPAFLSLDILVMLFFFGIFWRQGLALLNRLRSFTDGLGAYEELFRAVEKEPFENEELLRLQKELAGAAQAFDRLSRIGTVVSMRYNPILCFVLDCLFLWDCHCLELLNSWKNENGNSLRGWLKALGELEALLSLSALQDGRSCCFPELPDDSAPFLQAEGLSHPLISSPTPNSFSLGANTCVITGSNMSGKTTFLRSVGVNLALAYAGGPVCANRFTASCMAVFTSMRVHDDVSRGISTFYAELLRIKSMVLYSEKQLPMLSLIDEIFKGTNSADRIVGATETIRRLSRPWSMCIVSTHDFELCELENDSSVHAVNRHFSEYYEEDQIRFSYKIQDGRCRTTNARHLMRMVGILEQS